MGSSGSARSVGRMEDESFETLLVCWLNGVGSYSVLEE